MVVILFTESGSKLSAVFINPTSRMKTTEPYKPRMKGGLVYELQSGLYQLEYLEPHDLTTQRVKVLLSCDGTSLIIVDETKEAW